MSSPEPLAAGLGGIGGIVAGTGEQAIGFGIGQALASVLQPEATSLAQASWNADPSLAMDPQTAALLVRLGVITHDHGAGEARLTGMDGARFAQLVGSTKAPPAAAELLDLERRGKLPAGALRLWLERGGLDGQYLDAYTDLVRVHLSPADAAMARQQGFITVEQSHEIGRLGGLTPDDSDLLYELSGLPPGVVEGLELLRRGHIDEQRFAQIVREGHTKTKYTADLLNLRYTPLSPAIAAEAVVRERIPVEHGRQVADQNGMRVEDFDLYVNMLGRPMGIGQALTLVRRGKLDHAGFREVVARSDVRTEYADDLLELRTVYPPLFQLIRLVTAGTLDDATALDILDKEGYAPELAHKIVAGAHAGRTGATKHLAASIIDTLFEAGLESHEAAVKAIEALGYTVEQAAEYLDLHTARRVVSELTHGVTLVRSRYTSWKVDAVAAHDTLATLGVDAATIERLLTWWKAERDANAPVLTIAEIAAAFHYQRFTYDQATQELVKRGLSPDDALTVLWNRTHGDPRPGAGAPPAGTSAAGAAQPQTPAGG